MAKWRFYVHGGDFRQGKGFYNDSLFSKCFRFPGITWPWQRKCGKHLERIDLVTGDMVKAGVSKAGAGAAGFLLAGPIGAAVGVLFGGKQKRETTFIVTFTDGKSFLGTSNIATFQKLKAVSLKKK
ncbi:MAG TPA: hypothetical protein PLY87_25320 [Planctomycetaceae bacterium]|nr:hypothetical protein [Planctomycetaceae bacterium]HQZ68444.1 hypothetical protein [Planctomycetaceae bacterium]